MGAQGDAESMRASKKITAVLSSFILSILPFLILWAAWSVLPDTIPAHWSGGVVDRWGNKLELLVVPLFSLIGSIAISVYLIVSTRRREFLISLFECDGTLLRAIFLAFFYRQPAQ